MDEARGAPVDPAPARAEGRGRAPGQTPIYAALDLGTNNCRLLIAAPTARGFRIIDAFSRIVRLGEGLSASGRLGEAAMERALGALRICAAKIGRRGASRVRAVATQACRSADNGPRFLDEVAEKTGLRLSIISPREEAQLSVAGCLNLLDRGARAALVVDVGGGSTEMSWIDLTAPGLDVASRRMAHGRLPIRAWLSVPIGVVTLAERFPESAHDGAAWFRSMVEAMKAKIEVFTHADDLRGIFEAGQAHLVGTSGAITSLAGLHLGLSRYDRAQVDGLWMTRAECDAVTRRLAALTVAERAAQPCIGPDRADLVMAGAAILRAVQELWPCERVRVADRGLREGLLLSLISERGPERRRRGAGLGQSAAR
ncbi:MAG: Ppx/GppA family phosphatase [Pseudomonadota bacterium]|nr:Ppx/GppA family phosphatase [Pseudomonadota bacterium]